MPKTFTDLEFRDADFRLPPKLSEPGIPGDLDAYNRELIRIEDALGQASQYHLQYSLLKAKYAGQYQAEFDKHYTRKASAATT